MQYILGPSSLQTDFLFKIHKIRYSDNKVGVYFSGGIDSTALLCLILTELKNTEKLNTMPVICFTVTKPNLDYSHIPTLLQKIENKFNVPLLHHDNIPNDDINGNISKDTLKLVSTYYTNMIVYIGQNNMAPDNIRPFPQTLKITYGYRIRTSYYTSPFLWLHKPQIVDLLYKLNCEDLIPYTKSCSAAANPCHECYSCAERKWGFDALGKNDPIFD